MQTTIKTNKGEFLLVKIPDSCILFTCDMGYLIFKQPTLENWVTDDELWNPIKLGKYLKRVEGNENWKQGAIKLPDGNYKFLGATKSGLADTHAAAQNVTEEIADKIVANNGMGCYDNYRLKKDNKYTCTTALDSFHCLLEASGIMLDKTKECFAILQLLK